MSETTPKPNTEVPTQQTLAYWMGRVDSKLDEMGGLIQKILNADDGNWKDFRGWRSDVDARLIQGSENFKEINRRLAELEDARCPMGAKCPALLSNKPDEGPPHESPKENKGFGTWTWFRDSYLEKAVLIIVTLALYKIVEIIIQHWTVTPTP